MIQNLLYGLAAVMIAEGLVYLLAPNAVEEVLKVLKAFSVSVRRKLGALLLLAGLILLLLVT